MELSLTAWIFVIAAAAGVVGLLIPLAKACWDVWKEEGPW